MNASPPVNLNGANVASERSAANDESSLASDGSTIVLNRNANRYDEVEDDEKSLGCEVLKSDTDCECVVPLKGGDDFLEGGVTSGNPNASSDDIGNMCRVPRTNSYFRRAGMTPRMDDIHFLTNALSFASFSSVESTATNVTDARLSSMSSVANSSFASRNGLSAAAGGMTNTSNLRSDPRVALTSSQSSTSSSSSSASSSVGPTDSTGTSNSSLSGGVAHPRGTGNIFLRQDDTDYQNLLTSIVTSNNIAITPVTAGQQRTQAPISGATATAGNGPIDLRRSTSNSNSNSNTRRLSDEGTNRLDNGRNKVSRAGRMRRSSSSTVSILRRGRFSIESLSSVREDHNGGHNGSHDNTHNASFNTTNNNSVKFAAPTTHLFDGDASSLQQQDQHVDDKEQTMENAGDFDDDEQIPACILAAFAGGTL